MQHHCGASVPFHGSTTSSQPSSRVPWLLPAGRSPQKLHQKSGISPPAPLSATQPQTLLLQLFPPPGSHRPDPCASTTSSSGQHLLHQAQEEAGTMGPPRPHITSLMSWEQYLHLSLLCKPPHYLCAKLPSTILSHQKQQQAQVIPRNRDGSCWYNNQSPTIREQQTAPGGCSWAQEQSGAVTLPMQSRTCKKRQMPNSTKSSREKEGKKKINKNSKPQEASSKCHARKKLEKPPQGHPKSLSQTYKNLCLNK